MIDTEAYRDIVQNAMFPDTVTVWNLVSGTTVDPYEDGRGGYDNTLGAKDQFEEGETYPCRLLIYGPFANVGEVSMGSFMLTRNAALLAVRGGVEISINSRVVVTRAVDNSQYHAEILNKVDHSDMLTTKYALQEITNENGS